VAAARPELSARHPVRRQREAAGRIGAASDVASLSRRIDNENAEDR
jgi:hypothetical protein